MDIIISNAAGQPIYEQICRQIKGAIASGALKSGEPLPSIRALARDLRISVITTKRAYAELEEAGLSPPWRARAVLLPHRTWSSPGRAACGRSRSTCKAPRSSPGTSD